MDFDALVATMDDTVVSTFQKVDPDEGALEITLHSSDGSGDTTVPCVVKNPVMEEDYVPGSQAGASMLMLFIPAAPGRAAVRGQTATYNGVDYDVLLLDADRCGGVHLRLRARTQPYDL